MLFCVFDASATYTVDTRTSFTFDFEIRIEVTCTFKYSYIRVDETVPYENNRKTTVDASLSCSVQYKSYNNMVLM